MQAYFSLSLSIALLSIVSIRELMYTPHRILHHRITATGITCQPPTYRRCHRCRNNKLYRPGQRNSLLFNVPAGPPSHGEHHLTRPRDDVGHIISPRVSQSCNVDCHAKERAGRQSDRAMYFSPLYLLFNTTRVTAGSLSGALRRDRRISIGRSGRASSGAGGRTIGEGTRESITLMSPHNHLFFSSVPSHAYTTLHSREIYSPKVD